MKKENFIDKAEQEIIESYEKDEWKPIPSKDQDVYINAAIKSQSKS